MDNNIKLELYYRQAENIIKHILSMIEHNQKYVFSDACRANLDLYFEIVKKIENIKKSQNT